MWERKVGLLFCKQDVVETLKLRTSFVGCFFKARVDLELTTVTNLVLIRFLKGAYLCFG